MGRFKTHQEREAKAQEVKVVRKKIPSWKQSRDAKKAPKTYATDNRYQQLSIPQKKG